MRIIYLIYFISISVLDNLDAYLNYEDSTPEPTNRSDFYQEFEPVTTFSKDLYQIFPKNINCDTFSSYALNCTFDAASIYNSSRMSPPSTTNIHYWCKAIRYVTNCAIDWNTDCKNITDSHFHDDSIKGHIHVVNNICDDEWFLIRYEDAQLCIESASDAWEACYVTFKKAIEAQKNSTLEWTHYEVHFQLCCARARFRRCTLESLFVSTTRCNYENAITLQKFSIIVSEGAVYQSDEVWSLLMASLFFRNSYNFVNPLKDCDNNMMYANCPGGDPRPTTATLKKLMSDASTANLLHFCLRIAICIQVVNLLNHCFDYLFFNLMAYLVTLGRYGINGLK